MAAKKKAPDAAPPPNDSLYPSIESFIEHASSDDVGALFAPLRDGLGTLKGPRAEQGKKVSKAIERTEELLSYLLQVREKIEAERKGGASQRK
jgi:hypothetical protein